MWFRVIDGDADDDGGGDDDGDVGDDDGNADKEASSKIGTSASPV